ncbi:hypothetical protein KIW84_052716 [Lathyrus oleraceus]|uniref:Uncharacterized protein n=1 Tax=Pisum sativum TaxID=3888 RepID=A0A9D5AHT5_PEA|nr:hypothetical protein KIW84_052716 [Pisum sativum]
MISYANMDHLDVVIDAIPLSIVPGHVPTKRRARTPTMKKARPSTVCKSSNPYGSVQIPFNDYRNIEPSFAIKKPHSMTSLYLDPIKTTDVEHDVVASTKGFVVPKVVGSVKSTEKPSSEKLGSDFGTSDVVLDVTTSLAQTDHPIETPLEKYDGKSDSESVSIKSPEKSEEKDDSDSMSVDMADKEENSSVKKD